MNRSGSYVKQITGYRAFIPALLPPDPPIKIEGDLQNILSQADRSVARLDGVGYTLPNPDLFIAMYVKKEALLSSQIEGTQASLEDVFAFERGETLRNINDVEEVVNYVKAMNYGMERIKDFPVSLRLMREIHSILLEGVRGENKTPGEFRQSQNWIGPAGCLLKDATFVPPPPGDVSKVMGDLEKYLYEDPLYPPLIDCALIHYQFETIHPFLDGNGRLGRLMITLFLYWKEILDKPLLYLSYYLKKYRQEYYDRLSLVRDKGDFEQWITFFLKGVIHTSDSAIETAKKILELQNRHRNFLLRESTFSSPIALLALDMLFTMPVVSVKDVAKELNIPYQTASTVVTFLESAGILKEMTGKKRGKVFVYMEYLNILSEGTDL